MPHFLLKRADGGVSVMHLAANGGVETELAKWPVADRQEVVSWREIDISGIPSDRTFRNAWCDVTPEPVIDIDMTKARNIHRDRLREMRAPKLAALDIEYQRADEAGDTQAKRDISSRKQALRDVTDDPAIDAAKTPEELKLVIPAALQE